MLRTLSTVSQKTWQSAASSVSMAQAKAHGASVASRSTPHSLNTDQRLVELPFQADAPQQRLTLTTPSTKAVAPQGYYLLFALDANGVPSQGAMVKLS
ncbi:MAG: DUF1929 domain-containing protein [Halobacteriales archaeon]|nr:DUF1929 domain-containing protein [Halobacteriales archaeon]